MTTIQITLPDKLLRKLRKQDCFRHSLWGNAAPETQCANLKQIFEAMDRVREPDDEMNQAGDICVSDEPESTSSGQERREIVSKRFCEPPIVVSFIWGLCSPHEANAGSQGFGSYLFFDWRLRV